MQRLVLFDLDDTLIDRRRALEGALDRFAWRHGLTADAHASVLTLLTERASVEHFTVIREAHGLAASPQELWQDYLSDMAASASCPAGVLAGLDELKARGWRVGVATNGSADIQHAKLDTTGIARRVHAVCVSEEHGVRKPDPRLFATATGLCGAVPGDGGWMVGNDAVKDIAGGRSAGLATLWIGDPLQWPTPVPTADRTAPSALLAIRLLLELTA
ncbi:HAD hydrolase-like protein [Streptomyces sp. F8]|uniref:HAD family hydrolase n=1 Tax=Streptomyces sp. F8 TaxID=1436085 RepID=UPI0029D264F6|nr:HAD hydrolase-like protein [Streptomyces sp. F8]MDX6759501.1 HAD hydrolase-like protein [Streptomyces sp. F8]